MRRNDTYVELDGNTISLADLDAAEKLAKGSYPGQKPVKMEKTELVERIFLARDQLRKCAAR